MSEKKHVHVMRQDIRWGDMDAFGHVNNTVYFRYMETARIAFLEETAGRTDTASEGPVIVTAYCTFAKQLKYPGQIEVRTFVGTPGRSSIEVTHEIRLVDENGNADVVHAEGGAKVVWVNYAAEKSVPLPEALKALVPAA
ncbi:thioesterase family protein [Herbaspirillum sp. SJZ107]|uniref:acyl-CoA thioesterase n=1 Tax=Herbaspirillum sp. SJZ107 TaxID=2572881 RepID=UPI0011545230|nr:thioesterase family protein [Herbaspirillum sp. SJZ107]TQK03259.1 (3S)-malyl-CoA thioesterase [Herbaspirillum sp. SJZ107]